MYRLLYQLYIILVKAFESIRIKVIFHLVRNYQNTPSMSLTTPTSKLKNYKPPSWVNKRHFKGNWNYLNFYNKHVETFFNPENEEFIESKITTSSVIYPHQRGYKKHYGSEWSSEEKNKFFTALARHSIHRIDDIKEAVGTKSEAEIYVYYGHLKKTLRKLKRSKVKQQVIKGRKLVYYENNNILVNYKEMPLSYEMSKRFIRFEEVQAYFINRKEALLANEYERRFTDYEPKLFDNNALQNMVDLFIGLGHYPGHFSIPNRTLVFLEYLVEQKIREFIQNIMYGYMSKTVIYPKGIRNYATYKTNPMENFLYNLGEFESMEIPQRDLFNPSKVKVLPPVHDIAFVSKDNPENGLTIESIPQYNITNTNEKLDQQLFEAETNLVDECDIIQSRNHEHILLTFFATYQREMNKESMFTDEEMMGLTFEELKEYEDKVGWEFEEVEETPKKRRKLNSSLENEEEEEEDEDNSEEDSEIQSFESESDNDYDQQEDSSDDSDENDSEHENISDEDNIYINHKPDTVIDSDDLVIRESEEETSSTQESQSLMTSTNPIEQDLLTNFMYSYATYD